MICPKCKKELSHNFLKCPYCEYKFKERQAPQIIVCTIFIISVILMIFITVRQSKNSYIYNTRGEYANELNSMFSVGVNIDGIDTYEEGLFLFSPSIKEATSKSFSAVWDIYISKTKYTNTKELKETELAFTIGGIDSNEEYANISAGNYVYIKGYDHDGIASGFMNITVDPLNKMDEKNNIAITILFIFIVIIFFLDLAYMVYYAYLENIYMKIKKSKK